MVAAFVLRIFLATQFGVYAPPRPVGADAALVATDADAVLDGAMFDATGLRFAALDRAGGVDRAGRLATRGQGLVVFVRADRAGVAGAVPRDADVAVQLYPALVRDGAVVASSRVNTHREWRAALCVLDDRRLAFAVGRGAMRPFAVTLQRAGCRHAGYTDGGRSAVLATRARRWGSTRAQPVPTWLYARRGAR